MTTEARQPKVLIWDIESTSLNATFGTVLCIGWKWLGEDKVYVSSILDRNKRRDMLDDKHVVEDFVKAFNECDYHITWYGDRFDLPMIRSKMIKHGMRPIAPKPSLDLWRTARRYFKSHSNRLNVWEQILATPDQKTPLDFDAWLKAAHGDKDSVAKVIEHCEKDVLVLEEVFLKLRPWLDNEPSASLFTGKKDNCPSCNSESVQKRGFKVAMTRTYQQYQCNDCGKWFRSTRASAIATNRSTS